jgi:starch synthase
MANSTRILFVSDEVEPFSKSSATATLVRNLPEQLQHAGDYEMRIMMPRYGTISERKNRLHEVIRLSGTEIEMSDRNETLKVKVASIPGIRLQVYFMDNNHYFKRKGVYATKQGSVFDDNLARALFFARSSLETIRNLGWGPDVVHAFGWMSGFVPMLLRTEFGTDELFANTKAIFTPNQVDFDVEVDERFADSEGLRDASTLPGTDPNEIGIRYAHAAIFPHTIQPQATDSLQFGQAEDDNVETARSVYDQLLSEVAA